MKTFLRFKSLLMTTLIAGISYSMDNSAASVISADRGKIIEDDTVFTPVESDRQQFLEEEELALDHRTRQNYTDEDVEPKFGLSIAGGGIRGLIPAIELRYLQERFEESGYNKPLNQLFDYMGGTSIGGINALAIGAGLEPELLIDLMSKEGKTIFPPLTYKVKLKTLGGVIGSRYDPAPLEGFLKSNFGEESTLKDLSVPVLVTACTTRAKPCLFKSTAKKDKHHKLWEIARATSAAPTYFPAYELTTHLGVKYIDGGMWTNDPSFHILASMVKELHDNKFVPSHLYMLSLGTGDTSLETLLGDNVGYSSAATLIDVLMTSNSQGTHELMQGILGNNNYYSVNPLLGRSIDLADVSPQTIETLTAFANHNSQKQILDLFVDKYLDVKRRAG